MPFQCRVFRATEFLRWPNFCEGKIGGPWTPYEEEDAEAGRFSRLVCVLDECFFLPSMPGLGDGFPTFEKREGAVKLIVDLGGLHCFPCCNWCRKKPLGWCRSTGMWEL